MLLSKQLSVLMLAMLLAGESSPQSVMEVDYARYGVGEAMLGWLASSTLKPQKNTNSKAASEPSSGVPEATHSRPTWTTATRPTATKKTALK